MEKTCWTDPVRNDEVLKRGEEKKEYLANKGEKEG